MTTSFPDCSAHWPMRPIRIPPLQTVCSSCCGSRAPAPPRPAPRPGGGLRAASLLVAAIGAGAALGTGLIKLPWLVVEPSPSAEPSPSSSTEPSLPVATDDGLPVGSLARPLTELPLHDRPATDSAVQASIPAGQMVYLQMAGETGPHVADDAVWYPVRWAAAFKAWPIVPGGEFGGWLPGARDGFATVE